MYAFGQTFLFKRSTHGIVVGVDEIPETVRQAQHKQDGGIVPHRYTGVAFFKPSQSCPRDESTFRHKSRRNTPPSAGIPDICPQLPESGFDWPRQWGCTFHESNMNHIIDKNKKYGLYMKHSYCF